MRKFETNSENSICNPSMGRKSIYVGLKNKESVAARLAAKRIMRKGSLDVSSDESERNHSRKNS